MKYAPFWGSLRHSVAFDQAENWHTGYSYPGNVHANLKSFFHSFHFQVRSTYGTDGRKDAQDP